MTEIAIIPSDASHIPQYPVQILRQACVTDVSRVNNSRRKDNVKHIPNAREGNDAGVYASRLIIDSEIQIHRVIRVIVPDRLSL